MEVFSNNPVMAAPENAPILHMAWRLDKIGLPSFSCTASPCAFMEILHKLPRTPKPKRTTEIQIIFIGKEIPINKQEYIKSDVIVILLLPNKCTSQPAKGNATKAPMGSIKSKAPNSASFRSYRSLIMGIRDAQLEKIRPETKK